MTRLVVPGTREVALTEAGSYSIYHEYQSYVDGTVYSTDKQVPGLKCTLRQKDTGRLITSPTQGLGLVPDRGPGRRTRPVFRGPRPGNICV